MSTITLYCAEAEGLKLGPGTAIDANHVPGEVIVFERGFATIEAEDFPDLDRWLSAIGTPQIRVLEEGEAPTAEAAAAGASCPVCSRTFQSDFALNGHLRSHAPKS